MDRRHKYWFCTLAMIAAACSPTSEDGTNGAACPPLCVTPNPAQTGDSGMVAPMNMQPSTGGGMSNTGIDAGKPSTVPSTGGMPGGGADTGVVMLVDAGLNPLADGGAADARVDAAINGDGGTTPPSTGMGSMLPATTDYSKPGPFKTTMQANVGPNNNYTIFRPDPLGQDGFVHSPIIFGPGILTSASFYTDILGHFASHGFVTICVNSMWGGPGDPGNLSDMTMGLEWLIAQNSQAGIYQNKLAVDRAITMGYSIGATASVELSSHKAIMSTVVIHGHNTKGDPHGPVLMITGTNDVIDDMRKTLSTLEEAPAVLVALPIGHLDVLDEIAKGGRYIPAITAWLRYWVNGDQGAKSYFWGDGCSMCKSPWITPEPNAKWKAQML